MISQTQSPSFPPPPFPLWKDTPLHRLILATLINEFSNRILTHHSSTATIENWLRENLMAHALPLHIKHIAPETPSQTAHNETTNETTEARPPACPPVLCTALNVTPALSDSSLAYRKIHLFAEGRVFCIADNWYRPDVLTPSMRHQLETTDIPFGRVVRPLRFFRRILEHRVLWSPLPQDWQRVLFQHYNVQQEKEAPFLPVPHNLFEYTAILHTHNGVPFSALVETYTSEILNIPFTLPYS